MTYAVIWKATAIQQLGHILATAGDRARVEQALAVMERMLRRVPRDMGESRAPWDEPAGARIWYEDVLGLWYEIDESAMRVDILFVGPARRH